jgi:hypothetical protein
MSKFSTTGKGFQLTFENGLTISVQWGYFNYCTNRQSPLAPEVLYDELEELKRNKFFDCDTAEIAVWDESGKWMDFENDQVKGWVTADEVADYITKVKNATSIDELHEGRGLILE